MEDKKSEIDAIHFMQKLVKEGKVILLPKDFEAIANGTFDYAGFVEKYSIYQKKSE